MKEYERLAKSVRFVNAGVISGVIWGQHSFAISDKSLDWFGLCRLLSMSTLLTTVSCTTLRCSKSSEGRVPPTDYERCFQTMAQPRSLLKMQAQ